MSEVVGIKFRKNNKIYLFLSNNLELKKEQLVLVNTEKGIQCGKIVQEKRKMDISKLSSPLNEVIKICNKKDLENNQKNIEYEKKVLKKCKELVKKFKLNMYVLDAIYNFDRSQLIITYLADSRVDFRDLAKELASIYRTRIELKQLGVRDKAKMVGGYGYCGRQLCCSKFLNDLDSVSINMAKNQNIALNPTKINGMCGRLLCCLKYENETYKQMSKCLPKIGKKIQVEEGEGKVISTDILKQTYRVNIQDVGVVEKKVDEDN